MTRRRAVMTRILDWIIPPSALRWGVLTAGWPSHWTTIAGWRWLTARDILGLDKLSQRISEVMGVSGVSAECALRSIQAAANAYLDEAE